MYKLNFYIVKGYRNNCINACSEVSRWTYICEIMSVKVYQSIRNIDTYSNELINEFFESINETLRTPLQLASRNKKSILSRKQSTINDEKSMNKRFLQDYFITISDLILFYYVTKILNESPNIKNIVEEKYTEICVWYKDVIKCDLRITECFSLDSAPIQFDYLAEFERLKISDSLSG